MLRSSGDRCFAAAAPTCTVWNAIPVRIRKSGTLEDFKPALKTYLFKLAFNERDCWWDFLNSFCFHVYPVMRFWSFYVKGHKSNSKLLHHSFLLISRLRRHYASFWKHWWRLWQGQKTGRSETDKGPVLGAAGEAIPPCKTKPQGFPLPGKVNPLQGHFSFVRIGRPDWSFRGRNSPIEGLVIHQFFEFL